MEKKINQSKLSEMTGISRNTLYLIENHKTDSIAFETLDKLCIALECTPNAILDFRSVED